MRQESPVEKSVCRTNMESVGFAPVQMCSPKSIKPVTNQRNPHNQLCQTEAMLPKVDNECEPTIRKAVNHIWRNNAGLRLSKRRKLETMLRSHFLHCSLLFTFEEGVLDVFGNCRFVQNGIWNFQSACVPPVKQQKKIDLARQNLQNICRCTHQTCLDPFCQALQHAI